MSQSSVQAIVLLMLFAAIPSRSYSDEPESRSPDAKVFAGDIEPLEEAKFRWLWEKIARREQVAADVLHRALRAGQFALRADAARMLGEWGDADSVPHLIQALTDESSYVGGFARDPGMSTVRYWANDSLVKLTGRDFGFVWDDPLDKRNAAVLRWTTWYLTLDRAAAGAGTKDGADQQRADRVDWVAKCLKDFQTIKKGMTRQEVQERFPIDGGVSAIAIGRHRHPECPFFKVDVEFALSAETTSPDDKVIKISRPYIETPYLD